MRRDAILDHSWRSLVMGAVAAREFAPRPQQLDHGPTRQIQPRRLLSASEHQASGLVTTESGTYWPIRRLRTKSRHRLASAHTVNLRDADFYQVPRTIWYHHAHGPLRRNSISISRFPISNTHLFPFCRTQVHGCDARGSDWSSRLHCGVLGGASALLCVCLLHLNPDPTPHVCSHMSCDPNLLDSFPPISCRPRGRRFGFGI